jgi:chlorophyllide a oxygenase
MHACRYAVAFSSKLKENMLMPVELFGEQWVLFRDENGAVACIYDECAHRACPLSLGTIKDGHVQCPYHGWTFNQQGKCVKMPSTVFCKGIEVAHLPTVEQDGFVWVWPGDSQPVAIPENTLPPKHFTLHAEIEVCQQLNQTFCGHFTCTCSSLTTVSNTRCNGQC